MLLAAPLRQYQCTSVTQKCRVVSMSKRVFCRPATPTDAPVLTDILYRAFTTVSEKHGFPPDFPTPAFAAAELEAMFPLPYVEGIVAEVEGTPTGVAFLWQLGDVAGIGPVAVVPEHQHQGIGRALMTEAIERCGGAGSIRLLQAAFNVASLALYATLGFDVRESLICMVGSPPRATIPGYIVRSGTPNDFDAVNKLCHQVNCFSRALEVSSAETLRVAEKGGELVGYTTGVGFYGHTVALDNEAMKALIVGSPEISGAGLFLPLRNGDLFRWCLQHGLRATQPMTLMVRGDYEETQGGYLPNVLF